MALVPPGVMTVTSTVPLPGGEVAVMVLELLTVKLVAAVLPNFTAVAPVKPEPVMVADVPPAEGPEVGLTEETVGAATYVNRSAALAVLVPPGVVTLMSTVPLPAGEVAVTEVELFSVKLVAAVLPNFTAVAPVKFLPVTVTEVPPASGPEVGLTAEMEGTGIYANLSADHAELVPPGVVTLTSTVPLPAGEVAVMVLELLTVKLVAAVLPNLTAVAPVKAVPVMVTEVPTPAGPEVGLTEVTVGADGCAEVMVTFWTWWMSLKPPLPPVKPTNTDGGRLVE